MGVNKTRKGKRNETGNEARSRFEAKQLIQMLTLYKGIRFESKQNLDFKYVFKPTIIHFNTWTSLVLTI